MIGIIEKITAYPAKGEAGKELAKAHLMENQGLEGDFHAIGGDKQLSILFAETREAITAQKEKGLCFSRFRENITVSGFRPDMLRPGVRLAAGEAILEITSEGKHCHRECPLFQEGRQCPLAGMSLFAKVLKSGIIRAGDKLRENPIS